MMDPPPLTPPLLPPRLLEVHEVAYHLKSSTETVRRLIREKKLAAIHLGTRAWRVDPVDLRAFLDAQRVASHHGNGETRLT